MFPSSYLPLLLANSTIAFIGTLLANSSVNLGHTLYITCKTKTLKQLAAKI